MKKIRKSLFDPPTATSLTPHSLSRMRLMVVDSATAKATRVSQAAGINILLGINSCGNCTSNSEYLDAAAAYEKDHGYVLPGFLLRAGQ